MTKFKMKSGFAKGEEKYKESTKNWEEADKRVEGKMMELEKKEKKYDVK